MTRWGWATLLLTVPLAGCRDRVASETKPGAPLPSGPVPTASVPLELRAGTVDVRVCPRGKADGCRTITPIAFTAPRAEAFDPPLRLTIPSALRGDGAELFLARHEGKRGEAIYGETYDVASGARTSRIPLVADQHVNRVLYVGKRVFAIACIDDGPGCVGALVDPKAGTRTPVEGNFYGVDPPAIPLGGDRWAFVFASGARVDVRDVSKDAALARFDLATHGGPEDPVIPRFEPPGTLVLRFGGASAGIAEQKIDVSAAAGH